jgi:hypothetical protein
MMGTRRCPRNVNRNRTEALSLPAALSKTNSDSINPTGPLGNMGDKVAVGNGARHGYARWTTPIHSIPNCGWNCHTRET